MPLPAGVEVTLQDKHVTVSGPRGRLAWELPGPISLTNDGASLVFERPDDSRQSKALHGLARSLVANMVAGVTSGYTRELEIRGVGYRALAKGPGELELSLGFSHAVTVHAPPGVAFEVPAPTRIVVSGADKQVVGQVAADIRMLRKPEPYKGKGVRYAGEQVQMKSGKAGK